MDDERSFDEEGSVGLGDDTLSDVGDKDEDEKELGEEEETY